MTLLDCATTEVPPRYALPRADGGVCFPPYGCTAKVAGMGLSYPERTTLIRREAARLCRQLGWAPLHEVTLPNGRRADILALRPDGGLVCIEVKSGALDFLSDSKWPEYRNFSDALFFAVDADFPQDLLPEAVGLIVTAERDAAVLRDAPAHALPPARRRALLHRFANLAACRLENVLDPVDEFALACE